ncbi:MAG: substrate-binding domain-containing protein [Candidatus Hydrogenedentes bacterium]|nr:substrate-binding domain-containing protein [Candidatus Hydrogenedentota bacterium]
MRFPILTVLTILAAITSCSPTPGEPAAGAVGEPPPPASASKTVGASLLTQGHQFYRDLVAAMETEAKKQGYSLRIQYAEFQSPKQINQIETFVQQGVDALIVAPCDSAGIAPTINDAASKGIPVFTADIAAHNANVTSHIASDNVLGGKLIGEYLAKLLNGKGNVAIIDNAEVASVQERVAGFEEAIKGYPEIKIVQKAPGYGRRDKAMRAAQDVIQAQSDLNAIFGINDDSALGALAALESAGMQDKVIIVGYDGTPEARDVIRSGRALKADTVQHPEEIGRITIQTIADHFAGKPVPKIVPVRVDIIDKASLDAEQK